MNFNIKLHLLNALLFLLSSCSDKVGDLSESTDTPSILRSTGYNKLPTGNTLGFLTNSISYKWDHNTKEGIISIFNIANNSIINFREKNPLQNQEIKLKEDGPNNVGNPGLLGSHLYHSKDSIFIYNNPLGKLFLIDSQGQLLNSYLATDYTSSKNLPAPFPSTLRPFFLINQIILIPCGINNYSEEYSSYPSSLSIDLQTKNVSYNSVYPEVYDQAFWGVPFKWDTGISINPSQGKILYNYPISNNVYTTDLSFSGPKTINIPSNYFKSPQPYDTDPTTYLDVNKKFDYKTMENESMSKSDFAGILYDEFNHVYYRVAYLRPSLEEVKAGNKAPDFSIITLDENLEKIGEDYFDQKTYDNTMIFVSSKGLNIARKDLFYENEELIQFEVFKPN